MRAISSIIQSFYTGYDRMSRILLINASSWVQFFFRSMIGLTIGITLFICFTLYFILENQIVIYSLFGSAIGKILFMIWSSLKNPCYLDLNTENEESQSLINEEKRRKRKAGIICDDCGSRRPLRTYHCSKCYRCVIRYDHHSVLLNNCIGYGNQIQYGLFLLFSLLLDYIAWFVFVRYANFSSIFSDKKQIGYYLSSLVFVVIDTLNSISLSKLFMDNIVMNLTQYEADHYYRIGYLKDSNFRFYNPFFKSVFRSILEYLHIMGIRWSSCDIYSVVDIPGFAEQPTVSKSNVVVDTIRLISGIPHSRLATIMEEEEEEEEEEEMEEEYERHRVKSSQTLLRSMSEENTPFTV